MCDRCRSMYFILQVYFYFRRKMFHRGIPLKSQALLSQWKSVLAGSQEHKLGEAFATLFKAASFRMRQGPWNYVPDWTLLPPSLYISFHLNLIQLFDDFWSLLFRCFCFPLQNMLITSHPTLSLINSSSLGLCLNIVSPQENSLTLQSTSAVLTTLPFSFATFKSLALTTLRLAFVSTKVCQR